MPTPSSQSSPTSVRKKVMLSAIQPSNRLTIGNYLGALKNWVKLQGEYDCVFFAVDLHVITAGKQNPEELREQTYRAVATYLASGIDPSRAILFAQSHVPEHAELSWVLNCFTYMGELGRMTQYKDKSQKEGSNIPAGLFNYPVLMAADILLYDTSLVPVGADQKQHVELTRDVAVRMNHLYGGDLFVIPEIYHPPIGARIMSLQDPESKMSKSDPDPGSAIYLNDTDDQIRKKVKRAITDSGTEITDDDSKPGIRNLLTLQAAITGRPIAEIVASYAGRQYGHLKLDTAEICAEAVRPIREETQRILDDRSYLISILKRGAEQARERAGRKLAEVYHRVGFIPPP